MGLVTLHSMQVFRAFKRHQTVTGSANHKNLI